MTNTPTTDLYNVGLLETMCFQGVSNTNYWYMRGDYLYHHDPVTHIIYVKPLDQDINFPGWKPI